MHKKKGFFLIELMVAVSLVIVLVSIGIVQLSFLDNTLSHNELDKLMSACLHMQQRAIATNKELYLVFDIINNTYHFDTYHESLPKNICFGVAPGVKGPPGHPVDNIHKPITFPQNRICFHPTGIISSGTVYFINKNNKKLYALSNAVSQISYLRMYYYDGCVWKLYEDNKQ